MVRCDVEGVSGVVSYEQAEPGKAEYAFGQRMFMADLAALVTGLTSTGVEEICIYDEHYYGRNVDLAELPATVSVICGKPPYRADWAGGLDDSYDGLILLGFHAKFGTPGALLPHSYELDIADLRLNGASVGEIGMETAVAGDFGVPLLLVTGDSAGIAEAAALVPGAEGVVVKEALGESGAKCFPLSLTGAMIRNAAASVADAPPAVSPYTVGPGVALEVEMNEGAYLDTVRDLFSAEMSADKTLLIEATTATAAWAAYWHKKLTAQSEARSTSNDD